MIPGGGLMAAGMIADGTVTPLEKRPAIPDDIKALMEKATGDRLLARERAAHQNYTAGDVERIAAAHDKRQRKAAKRRALEGVQQAQAAE